MMGYLIDAKMALKVTTNNEKELKIWSKTINCISISTFLRTNSIGLDKDSLKEFV